MKLVRFRSTEEEKYGILKGSRVFGLRNSPFSEGWDQEAPELDETEYALEDVKLLVPCQPTKYLGVGLNFAGAARAMGRPAPEYPVTFLKPSGACIATGEAVEV